MKPHYLTEYYEIRCNNCGNVSELNLQHLKRISEKSGRNLFHIMLPDLFRYESYFKCRKCTSKNASIVGKVPNRPVNPLVISRPEDPRYCIKCGEKIPEERRKAVPDTNLCVGCKRAEEL